MKAQIFNYTDRVHETEPVYLYEKYSKILEKAWFNVVSFQEKKFEPFGYTCIWLLSESHLAIHTFPECWRSYVELASCVLDKYNNFIKLVGENEQD